MAVLLWVFSLPGLDDFEYSARCVVVVVVVQAGLLVVAVLVHPVVQVVLPVVVVLALLVVVGGYVVPAWICDTWHFWLLVVVALAEYCFG